MRSFHFPRAIAALTAAAGALALSPIFADYAAAERSLADVSYDEWHSKFDVMNEHCNSRTTYVSDLRYACNWLIETHRTGASLLGQEAVELGHYYDMAGNFDEAESQYSAGIANWTLDDNSPNGIALENPADPGHVRANAEHANAYCARGDLYWRHGDTRKAEADFRDAASRSPLSECADHLAALQRGDPPPPPPHLLPGDPGFDAPSMLALSDACSTQKAAALAVLFPNGATAQQEENFDRAFAQRLTGASPAQLMPQWQTFSDQSAAGAPHAAENAFAACVFHQRIQDLDASAVFQAQQQDAALPTPEQQTDQLFATLPRRDGGAGANMIAESLDPAARAERQRLQQQADAERQARQQQAAANNAAFWDGLLGVVATVGNAYVNYESQRAQIEANNQAAAAQAAASALAAQQQQQAASPPSQGGYAYTTVDGRCIGTACPAQAQQGSTGGTNGGRYDQCVALQSDHAGAYVYQAFHNVCQVEVDVRFRTPDGRVSDDSATPGDVFHLMPTGSTVIIACRSSDLMLADSRMSCVHYN